MFRKLKWKLVRFNMALLSLVFAAILDVYKRQDLCYNVYRDTFKGVLKLIKA